MVWKFAMKTLALIALGAGLGCVIVAPLAVFNGVEGQFWAKVFIAAAATTGAAIVLVCFSSLGKILFEDLD